MPNAAASDNKRFMEIFSFMKGRGRRDFIDGQTMLDLTEGDLKSLRYAYRDAYAEAAREEAES